MQLCRIIYYYFAALHVSSNIFAHHQEHLNCNTVYYIIMHGNVNIKFRKIYNLD